MAYASAEAVINLPPSDPRYGIPLGNDEADSYSHTGGFSGSPHGAKPDAPNPWLGMQPRMHHLSAAAEMSRAFTEMGKAWKRGRRKCKAIRHYSSWRRASSIAPQLQRDQNLLNRTVKVVLVAAAGQTLQRMAAAASALGTYSEMIPALLNDEQIDEIYRMGNGEVDCSNIRGCGDARAHILQVGSLRVTASSSLTFLLAWRMACCLLITRALPTPLFQHDRPRVHPRQLDCARGALSRPRPSHHRLQYCRPNNQSYLPQVDARL